MTGFFCTFGTMRGLNKVTLIGNPGKDPEGQVLDDHIAVAPFALATPERCRDKHGQLQPHPDWHSIVLWRGPAALARAYRCKGSLGYIEGKLKNCHYDDKDGIRRYVTESEGEQLILPDKKTGEPSAP